MTLDLPTKYDQVTVGQLSDYLQSKTDHERIAAICNISIKESQSLPFLVVEKAKRQIAEILSPESEKKAAKFQPIVLVGKRKYGFVPDLEKVTTAEYLDFVELAKPDNFQKSIVKLMTLMYRPVTIKIGNKYQIEPYDTTKLAIYEAEIRSISASYLSGCMLFFSSLHKELLACSLQSLRHQLKKVNKELKPELRRLNRLKRNGTGITSSQLSPMGA